MSHRGKSHTEWSTLKCSFWCCEMIVTDMKCRILLLILMLFKCKVQVSKGEGSKGRRSWPWARQSAVWSEGCGRTDEPKPVSAPVAESLWRHSCWGHPRDNANWTLKGVGGGGHVGPWGGGCQRDRGEETKMLRCWRSRLIVHFESRKWFDLILRFETLPSFWENS